MWDVGYSFWPCEEYSPDTPDPAIEIVTPYGNEGDEEHYEYDDFYGIILCEKKEFHGPNGVRK